VYKNHYIHKSVGFSDKISTTFPSFNKLINQLLSLSRKNKTIKQHTLKKLASNNKNVGQCPVETSGSTPFVGVASQTDTFRNPDEPEPPQTTEYELFIGFPPLIQEDYTSRVTTLGQMLYIHVSSRFYFYNVSLYVG
jgi:hypothetical protein